MAKKKDEKKPEDSLDNIQGGVETGQRYIIGGGTGAYRNQAPEGGIQVFDTQSSNNRVVATFTSKAAAVAHCDKLNAEHVEETRKPRKP